MPKYIADFHIHSKYSRACSRDLDLEHIEQWAKIKGINVVGTADFTHPYWFKELKEKLVEEKPGLFKLKSAPLNPPFNRGGREGGLVLFMLTTEVSCIYSQDGKTRRLHTCIFVPDFSTIEKINKEFLRRGINLSADGRPIMGLSAKELAKIILDINEKSLIIPAHAWTPWFSVFGSNSGFDSLQECFGEMTKYIYSIETGLSSNPLMNWRVSALDKITLISNSDAHSPANLGREANVFKISENKLSYQEFYRIIKEKDKDSFLYTIEFFPEEGKYHWDGHRACSLSFSPKETKKHQGICPKCKKSITIGVMNRVEQLADRPENFVPKDVIGYKSLVPLPEIIAEVLGQAKNTKKVEETYQDLIKKGGSEFDILLKLSLKDLESLAIPEIVLSIKNVREGKVKVLPGYDGVYGKVQVLGEKAKIFPKQKSLF